MVTLSKKKQEEVTCSFHYMVRKEINGREPTPIPFSKDEFGSLCTSLCKQVDIDLTKKETCDFIKNTESWPVEQCTRLNERTLFGRFRSLYSGHSYDNTDVGEVPQNSVSLRPFFFLLYLSESGRIYVGSQYLGQFGGWVGLFNTLRTFLSKEKDIFSISIRDERYFLENAIAKEIIVKFSKKPRTIDSTPKFGDRGEIVFKRQSKDDTNFKEKVSKNILSKIGDPSANIKKIVSDIVSESEVLEICDDDIEDCTILAISNGKKHTINVLDTSNAATRFPLNITKFDKGHPDKTQSQEEMSRILRDRIISSTERA